jgi:hypothetical protein
MLRLTMATFEVAPAQDRCLHGGEVIRPDDFDADRLRFIAWAGHVTLHIDPGGSAIGAERTVHRCRHGLNARSSADAVEQTLVERGELIVPISGHEGADSEEQDVVFVEAGIEVLEVGEAADQQASCNS